MHNTHERFGTVTKTFHWLTAALILTAIVLGVMAHDAPFETPQELARKAWLFSFHKTIGIAAFFVATGRVLWAISQPKPDVLHSGNRVEVFMASLVHWLLYSAMILVPLTGWITHASSEGFAPHWWPFGQSLPFIPKSVWLMEITAALHMTWEKILIAAIVLHIAGALKHHVIDKDATLKRMWFGSTTAAGAPHRFNAFAPMLAAIIYAAVAMFAVNSTTDPAPEPTTTLEQGETEWNVSDGSLTIKITQFGSAITGAFSNWAADIDFDTDTRTGFVTVTIDIASLTLGSVTDQAMGADYFDAQTHPTAIFTGPITQNDGQLSVDGTLRLKGVELPLALPFDLAQAGDGFSAKGATTLPRLAFGIGASQPDAATLGLDVQVSFALTAQKKAPD